MAISFKQSTQSKSSGVTTISENTPMVMMLHPESEPEITVDMDARTITVPDELKNIGVVADNNAETVYIRIPSTTFDGISLADKTAYVRYINAGGEYRTKQLDVIAENDSIKLGWTIDNDTTHYPGAVHFQITFELGAQYKWSTVPATIYIRAGLDIDELVDDPTGGVIDGVLSQITEIQNEIQSFKEGVMPQIKALQNDAAFLKDNAVFTLDDYSADIKE